MAVIAAAVPSFPALTGRVVDEASLLSPATEARLTEQSATLEASQGVQLVVVTLPHLQGYEIADFGYQLGRAWGIGREGADDGVLLIVAEHERKVRIEVGYGLEGVLTDALCHQIIHRDIVPAFRAGSFDQGVSAGAGALVRQLGADPAERQAALDAARRAQLPSSLPAEALILLLIFVLVVVFFPLLVWLNVSLNADGGDHSYDDGSTVLWSGDSSGDSSGGFSGGGGGFSGGGGSFGGGGASGGW